MNQSCDTWDPDSSPARMNEAKATQELARSISSLLCTAMSLPPVCWCESGCHLSVWPPVGGHSFWTIPVALMLPSSSATFAPVFPGWGTMTLRECQPFPKKSSQQEERASGSVALARVEELASLWPSARFPFSPKFVGKVSSAVHWIQKSGVWIALNAMSELYD